MFRSEREIETSLTNGFGAFIEARYLAGIGALLPYPKDRAGEVASLYALTRFLGEGVGMHLLGFAISRAKENDMDYVFACTTSPRVEAFFGRAGFRTARPDELPEGKWEGYDPDRRAELRCLRLDLA